MAAPQDPTKQGLSLEAEDEFEEFDVEGELGDRRECELRCAHQPPHCS